MYINREELRAQRRYYIPLLKKSFFIHPTDLMYSIGCDATNNSLVMKLRLLKHWQQHPFNVIAPNKQWILDNMDVPQEALDHLPGPVTIIGRLTNPDAVAHEVHLGTNIIGVRIPKHWVSGLVAHLDKPIVSTCANKRAQCLMTQLEDGHPDLLEACAIILHEGTKSGQQPVFIDYSETTIVTS